MQISSKMKFIAESSFRRLLVCASAFFFLSHVAAQNNATAPSDSVKRYVDTILQIAREHSLFRKNADWPAITDSLYAKIQGAKTIPEAIPAIQYMLKALGDKHGALVYDGKWYSKITANKVPDFRKPLLDQLIAGVKLKTALFSGGYGYILIPYVGVTAPADVAAYAQGVQDSICKINSPAVKGWIIDLRLNRGGNMNPMLAGIGNIIGDGKIGAFLKADGTIETDWDIKGGDLYVYGMKTVDLHYKCAVNDHIKVAVLLSEATCSSGEVVAIALKGRLNTRFFGERTSGFVTANNTYLLDNHSFLLLATNYEADRNNKIYRDCVEPDVTMINGDDFSNLESDLKIKAALAWLAK
jgi:carboxyl-terminal processing protease